MVSLPGGNILGMANRVIAAQKPMYRPFIKRESNAAGVFELWYATPVALTANIQPVPRSRYDVMGLDFQKNYVMIYTPKNVIDIAREVSGDQFWFSGKLFQAESKTSWYAIDGWDAILCVETPGYSPPFPNEEVCCADA